MLENYVNIHDVKEIRSRAFIYFGCGAIQKITDIATQLKERGISRVMAITGKGAYKRSGAWDPITAAFDAAGIQYDRFSDISPNPNTDDVDAAVKQGRAFGAQAILGIGGGSSIDAAKSTAILMEYPDQTAAELYEYEFIPTKALPIIAVNLTHGTGSEGNRVAVATILSKNYKPAIAYECIYPTWSIDDPELMLSLSPFQILHTSVDAVNHVVEAATTTCTSPYAITLARDVIVLSAKYLPMALKDPADLVARYHLAYAALLAGISFDNGYLHLTHSLEHPLSAIQPTLTHGLGLGILLPSVIKTIYAAPQAGKILADILAPLVPGLTGDPSEALKAAKGMEKWLFSVGECKKLSDESITEADIDKLVDLVFTTPSLGSMLAVSPVKATREVVANIYRESLAPIK